MKKIVVILLSVALLSLAGCGNKSKDTVADSSVVDTESVESTEIVKNTEEVHSTGTEIIEAENTEKENESPQTVAEDSTTDAPVQNNSNEAVADNSSSSNNAEAGGQSSQPQQDNQSQQSTPAQPEQTPSEPAVSEPQTIAYSPENVVALATAKTKAAGKVLLTDNLNNLLASGQITQEDYNAYYPYDGAGYYSVFVDSNLAEARDVSGTQKFNSEDDIAQYIADMLALESGPYFLIEYAGTYDYYGKICYEFRCYRA